MPDTPQSPASAAPSAERSRTAEEPRAACVLCQEPSEYPESHRGSHAVPALRRGVEGQRTACSG
ncbi:hypothetical protein GA0115246_115072 [Streptomyces sp. SolWspMP-sol7th]|uniref:hypothetical protein n=1 Tax=Streptomyces sp. SolWspMP-sol7th TaxID=1839776 RepID=UPI00081F5C0B|nr:hypothetical protein [Streptomyces sp. SolWspMP-sol7th]SCE35171.1 hypothetical protein GA0115246_115072 [Streptomyces sp. SolWspMP-sol7th]